MIDKNYVERITSKAPIEFYLSANDGARIHLPGRMQPVHEANERYVSKADSYVVDSSFNRKDITNIDVLDKAVEVGANQILLEDIYMDLQGTIENVGEGIDLAKDHVFDGRVICPLQAPYVECWERLGKPKDVAIGGLKDGKDSDRIEAAKNLRAAGGNQMRIHGLGWGLTDRIVSEVRYNPNLLDSIDSRTPYDTARKKELWPSGEEHKSEVSTIYSVHAYGEILEGLRRTIPDLSSNPNGAAIRECDNGCETYNVSEMTDLQEHVTQTLSQDLCESCASDVVSQLVN